MTLFSLDIGSLNSKENCFGGYCPKAGTNGTLELERIMTMIFGFLTIVGGLAFLIYFALGAVSWITAGGDTGNVDKAKKQMTNAAIGMIIIVATYAITQIIGVVLGINILNPATLIEGLWGNGATSPNMPQGAN
jgi:hypothetical protein